MVHVRCTFRFIQRIDKKFCILINRFKLGYGCTIGFPTILIPAVQGGNGGKPSEGEFRLTQEEISWLSMFYIPILFSVSIYKQEFLRLNNTDSALLNYVEVIQDFYYRLAIHKNYELL